MDIGLFVEVYTNPMLGAVDHLFDIQVFDSYNHEILANGGYWTAQIVRSMSIADAEEWYAKGLGRKVIVRTQDGKSVWQGIVNQVTLNAGATSEVRGPLLDICNRASAAYTPRDFSVYPPVDGTQTTTLIADDTGSQLDYGIFEKMISAGTTTEANADKARDVFLLERKLPKTTNTISLSPGQVNFPAVTIDCVGLSQMLAQYIYSFLTPGTSSYLTDKLMAILAFDPNALFNASTRNVEENLYLVNDLEDQQRMAWDIIQELIGLGHDTDDVRCLFGIYNDGHVFYNSMPTVISYIHKLSEQAQRLVSYDSAATVYPWEILPGRWVNVPDFLIGRPVPSTNLRSDPRNKFIESVRYTAPWTVELQCGDTDRLSQMLSKITYSGGIY